MTSKFRLIGVALALSQTMVLASAAEGEGKSPQAQKDVATLAAAIDQAIDQRLRAEGIAPSPSATDAEFHRRVYLDIVGVIPSADKAAAFLKDQATNKRAVVIDELLANPLYGRHMTDIWQGLLVPQNSDNRRLDPEPLVSWLEKEFNNNLPWDTFVAQLISASGSQDKNAAVTFFVGNPTVDKMTDSVSRLFLGIQLQCAQCHNHPFTPWKQDDYWGMATFFSKVNPDPARKAARQGTSPSVSETERRRRVQLPESAKEVPARFLTGEKPKLNPKDPYRPTLAKWLTSPSNPYFARAMVNRIWAQFFGRGIVNPIDDMHDDNPASHPELLAELSRQFAQNGFDVKNLIRAVCNSQAYQRTSKPAGDNALDIKLFSHMGVKALTPEQLYDSLVAVVGAGPEGGNKRRPNQAKQAPVTARARFVAFFRTDDNSAPTEYDSGIPQALRIMNSAEFNRGSQLVDQALKNEKTTVAIVERLFLGTLTRPPSVAESERLDAFVRQSGADKRKAYADVVWVLMNSSEFTLNH